MLRKVRLLYKKYNSHIILPRKNQYIVCGLESNHCLLKVLHFESPATSVTSLLHLIYRQYSPKRDRRENRFSCHFI